MAKTSKATVRARPVKADVAEQPGTVWAAPATAARWLLAVFISLVLCPVRYYSASTGLDPSWAVSLNQFQVDGVLFGRDVLLTYGPLAYLIFPMPYGTNLEQGIAFQTMLWAAFAATVFFLVWRSRTGLLNLAIAALCVPPGVRLIHEFGYAGPDFFLEFLVIFWLACALYVAPGFYYASCIGALLLTGIKLSTAIGALSAVLALPLLMTLTRDRRALRFAAASWIGVPAIFAFTFRLYSGSWTATGRYLRSALDFSSGGGTALSLAGPVPAVYAGLMILAGFAVLAAAIWWQGNRLLAVFSTALLGPVFLEFKHSFLRQDSHEAILFTFAPLMLLTLVWFVRFEFPKPRRVSGPAVLGAAAVALIVVPWFRTIGAGGYIAGHPLLPTATVVELARFGELKQRLTAASEAGLAPDRLPPELTTRLQDRTVSIYPWETAYAAANSLRHKPMPVFQSYLAYTPWLDSVNAEFFATGTRPDAILFNWAVIDDRHPFLDCPQTFLAIYLNYEFEGKFGPHLLLRKRRNPLAGGFTLRKRQPLGWGESLHAEAVGGLHLAEIPATFSFAGMARNFLFRTDPMYLTLSGPGGNVVGVRVPPAVLDAAFPFQIVPMDLDDTAQLFGSMPMRERFDRVALSGPGRTSFRAPLQSALYEMHIPAPPAAAASIAPAVPGHASPTIERMMLERVNGQGVADISSRETLAVSGLTGFVQLEGWAVLASPESQLFIDVDGKRFLTEARPNPLLASMFPAGTAARSFEAKLPAGEFGAGGHTLRLVEVPKSGDPPRLGERTLTIRIDPR